MSHVTTHVLDTALGRPAAGVPVQLAAREGDTWVLVADATTDDDGRVRELGPEQLAPGHYRLRFDTGAYFAACGQRGFHPEVLVVFELGQGHHHVPLLLSPFAYSTYRGS